MDKSREFRFEHTTIRLDDMPHCTLRDKLEFTRLMKRWFDQRIHQDHIYDPLERRREFVSQCKTSGHKIEFPKWVTYQEEAEKGEEGEDARTAQQKAYEKMPEYKRLIWFLGSTDLPRRC